MPPPLELPTIQNWSCHNCGGCCRQHSIEITPEERARITAQNWTVADGIPTGRPLFVRLGVLPWGNRYRLGNQADGGCVFLDDRGLCRIHAKFGEAAKPLACRIYPYAFHPAGRKITVSLRFSCPSVVANKGRPVVLQRDELKSFERLVVPEGAERTSPPEVSAGQRLDWPDTLKFVDVLDTLLAPGDAPVVVRLLRGLRFVELVGAARFDKVREARLSEFLEILQAAASAEVSADLSQYAEPKAIGRTQFRLLAAQYARRDTFAERQLGLSNRWKLFRAGLRFARGKGSVPALQGAFKSVPFAELEPAFGPLSSEADEILTRYLLVKVRGMHFCGRAHADEPLVEGFQALTLVVPVVLWIARWLAVGDGRRSLSTDDVARALAIADHHHGYAPKFGQPGFRTRVRLLAHLGEIPRLVAWYGK
ncbi:MAG: YkgJ family cysteine cluster protein [Planctomycetaceae bacterium]